MVFTVAVFGQSLGGTSFERAVDRLMAMMVAIVPKALIATCGIGALMIAFHMVSAGRAIGNWVVAAVFGLGAASLVAFFTI